MRLNIVQYTPIHSIVQVLRNKDSIYFQLSFIYVRILLLSRTEISPAKYLLPGFGLLSKYGIRKMPRYNRNIEIPLPIPFLRECPEIY